MQNLLRGKFAVNTVDNGSQEIHLIGCQTLGLLFKQRGVLVDNILTGCFEILFRCYSRDCRKKNKNFITN